MPVKPKVYIDRLIKALEEHGRYYTISNRRFHSEYTGRYCTKYRLEDMQTGVKIDVYNKLEILKYLVREFSEVTGREVPAACLEPLDTSEPKPKETRGRPRKRTGVSVLKNFEINGGRGEDTSNRPKHRGKYNVRKKTS